jgi:hypothetical protein
MSVLKNLVALIISAQAAAASRRQRFFKSSRAFGKHTCNSYSLFLS